MKKILVIGSANIDTTHYVDEFPSDLTKESANTIKNTSRVLGGKGANQAISAALQSEGTATEVYFIGCVGHDESGLEIIQNLKDRGINYSGVTVLDNESTDGRIIFVDKAGDNKMLGFGNCIKNLTPDLLFNEKNKSILDSADCIMIQLKMPAETIEKVIDYYDEEGKLLLVDPTPIEKSNILVEKNLLDKITFLSPNEEEAYALAMYEEGKTLEDIKNGMKATSRDERLEIIKKLIKRHPNIIATIGDKGVIYSDGAIIIQQNAYPTNCIDSTGAGDTFNGAFVAAITRGENLQTAIDYALTDCAHKVQFKGAQNGMQTFGETAETIYMRSNDEEQEL